MNTMDKAFMIEAINMAKEAREKGNEPFGAILVKDNKIVMRASNQIFSGSDPTYHAEIGLIRDFCRTNNTSDLSEYTLYTSCEPCCMCAGAMVWSKLGKMVYSVTHDQLAEIAGSNIMISSEEIFENSPNKPTVLPKLLNEEGLEVFDGYKFG
ncbi:nucleoside deaminase [Vallitalea sp.]|jgi:tRNA(Arg) A34 adenosine deaminase TadA|uniref:nucleoside deaminase n=1 Tax=Vallitalea sp. TaxID=1882829 RepID=UPI0025FECCDD|nr:nucleoside deaminase [Vallitalea sp.]MCT4686131.1 nucleoside deaminase [Vallitalea sp.]